MGAVERYQPQAVERLAVNQVQAIANTDLIPRKLRGNVAAIMATIFKGRALGLDDMHSLTAIHFVDGTPTLAAETMVMLARRAGHSIKVTGTGDTVTVIGKRADNGDTYEATWTLEMAGKAGLLSKDNWKKYPRVMLAWRASGEVCRILFPDVLAGVSHTFEELERTPEEQVSDAIGQVGPPVDEHQPDDRPPSEPSDPHQRGIATPVDVQADGSEDVIEGHVVEETTEPPHESEGEPIAADASVSAETPPVVPAAAPASEPGSPSDIPATDADGQASIFEQMADQAQSRGRGVADG